MLQDSAKPSLARTRAAFVAVVRSITHRPVNVVHGRTNPAIVWLLPAPPAATSAVIAVVQQHHAVWSMAQLRFEMHRALPVLPPGTDAEAVVTQVATLAVCGRAGTEVI